MVLAKVWLVFCSLFFYGYWNPVYVPLIAASIIVNYLLGLFLGKTHRVSTTVLAGNRKAILVVGIAMNLFLLGFFKYVDFFLENISSVTGRHLALLHIILPLAISFFTFQQIAYLVDSYRQKTGEPSLLDYSLFVIFFPKLQAGPIVRHGEMMPQFDAMDNKRVNYQNLSVGLYIFSIGLIKKAVVADTFALWANMGYEELRVLTFAEAWIASLSYTMQLYFDFSGYTDMAIGSARMFNIKLPKNFDSPYKALSIQDFWRRWHMTLSRFLRDYIYIPLGGNRKGNGRTYVNLIITFFLGGLWHGAGWTFIVWGMLHGLAATVNRFWHEKVCIRLPKFLAWVLTFMFVHIAWVFFRAQSFAHAAQVLRGMFGLTSISGFSLFNSIGTIDRLLSVAVMIPAGIIILLARNSNELEQTFRPSILKMATVVGCLFLGFLYLNSTIPKEFLYFDF